MSTTTPVTAADLMRMRDDGNRYELVAGELRIISPSGWKHGEIVANLHGILW
jgi:Uma2 family endonuclease